MKIKNKTKKINALYIHIPFCHSICSYCDFLKFIYNKRWADLYIEQLKNQYLLLNIKKGQLKTIYFGGGTPTSLSIKQLKKLLDIFKNDIKLAKEVTFEANVEDLNLQKLKILKQYGINRLSIGVQSFNNEILKEMNRHHNKIDVVKCIKRAKNIGFNNINIDLIFGYEKQDFEILKDDIKNVLSLNVEHVSCYSLILEKNTKLYLENKNAKDDDTLRSYFDYVHKTLKKHGYIHYEISNFAKKGYFSKHNLNYWKDNQYYALGVGSSGYVNNYRYKYSGNLISYLKGEYNFVENEKITLKDDVLYYLMLNLRTKFGFTYKDFYQRFNFDISIIKPLLNKFKQEKLLKLNKNNMALTYDGAMILDSVVIDIISALEKEKCLND